MKIRFAKKSDKEAVLNLITELANVVNIKRNKPLINVKDVHWDLFDKLLKRDDVKIFLAEDEGKIVGLATVYIIPTLRRIKPRAELEELIVTENMRRKGVGKKLFDAILAFCKRNNIYALKLTSDLELTQAHLFYEKQGGKFTEKMFRFDLD